MSVPFIKALFYVSAAYDGILGVLFLFLWQPMFRGFGVTPPNHPGYVQFPALLLIIFAALFLQIARDPQKNRDLIGYGIALKIAYSGIVFWYALTTGVPTMWLWCAWIDLAFLVFFIAVSRSLRTLPR
jgi:hypothetical protein